MRSVRTAVAALSTIVLAWPGLQALAEPPPSGPSAAVSAANTGTAMNTSAAAPDQAPAGAARRGVLAGLGTPVASDKLDVIRGGSELVVNDMRLAGTVADNSAINMRTGSNIVSDGSFASAAGLPTVIQNTGSNVLIQNATIINVQFKP
ncbi:hypothetical protein P3W85_16400 [Cupriavidus basilensis]|uniref:Uncharacterized protein n=1 Tax=Cupriavidus basilensis TaxID=68895 RepID=A0ABT6APH2_9BURK|nr:hypothetical protein [Cupriavidus basilensis]MDF3834524.1 hypothetical protein [Cupriavidus basilensis]